MSKQIEKTSSALEKGIELARDFVDKLIMPAAEEVGLMFKDRVSLWRVKNLVRVCTKAREYCESNGIKVGQVSPKLLIPLLEGAGLEDDELLQDKWAILLSNLVDSEQNIQNHVFPFVLSQISELEFTALQEVYLSFRERQRAIEKELENLASERPKLKKEIQRQITQINKKIKAEQEEGKERLQEPLRTYLMERYQLIHKMEAADREELMLKYKLHQPEIVPEEALQDFEFSNVIRLGLVKLVQETYAEGQSLEIPPPDYFESRSRDGYHSIDLNVELYTDSNYVLTELGYLFVRACTEKSEA